MPTPFNGRGRKDSHSRRPGEFLFSTWGNEQMALSHRRNRQWVSPPRNRQTQNNNKSPKESDWRYSTVSWSGEIIRGIGATRINNFFRRIRSTQIDQTQYPTLVQILTETIGADSLDRGKWALWGEPTLRNNIQGSMAHIVIRTIMTLTHG